MTPNPTHPLGSFLLLLNRLTLGLYVALAGADKLFKLVAGEIAKHSLMSLKPDWLPVLLAKPLDIALPLSVIVFGLLMAMGLFTRIAAAGLTVTLGFVAFTLMTELGLSGGGPVRVHHIVVLITLSLLIAFVGPGLWSLDILWRRKTWS